MLHERPLVQQVATPGLVQHYMARIWNCDSTVNAVVEACAPTTDAKFPDNEANRPRLLEGVPFLVKDSMDVLGFHTTCGSRFYENNPPAAGDSKLVVLLKHLGAIPIGKTNVPLLLQDVQTFNEVYGTTCNPYNAKLSAGGSSGGSAAAVALGLAAFAIGTDWIGSLRIPAAFCGVSSLRASRGRMTLDGDDHILPPMSADPDQTGHILVSGIFTKTVADLKFIMDALFQLLPCQLPRPGLMNGNGELQVADIAVASEAGSVIVGVWTSFRGVPLDKRIKDSMEAIPARLQAFTGGLLASAGRYVVKGELTDGPILDMAHLHKALQFFSQNLALADKAIDTDRVAKLVGATAVQTKGAATIDAFLISRGYAALLTPVCAVLPHEHNFDHLPLSVNGVEVPYWRAMCGYVTPISVAGNPVVTMPLCFINGRPCGIQVIGRMGHDEELLRVCASLELQFTHTQHGVDK